MEKLKLLKQALQVAREQEPQELKAKMAYFKAKHTLEKNGHLFIVNQDEFLKNAAKHLKQKTLDNWQVAKLYSFYAIDTTRDPMFPATSEYFYIHCLTKLKEDEIKILENTNLSRRNENTSSKKLLSYIKSGDIIPINLQLFESHKTKKDLLSTNHFLTPVIEDTIQKTWQTRGKKSQYGYYYNWISLPFEHINVFGLLDKNFENVAAMLEDVIFEEVKNNINKEENLKQQKIKQLEQQKLIRKEKKREQIKIYLNQIEKKNVKIKQLEKEISDFKVIKDNELEA